MGSSCSEENFLNLLFDLLYHLVLIIQELFLINDVAAKREICLGSGGTIDTGMWCGGL
jgi:hypothetical protein